MSIRIDGEALGITVSEANWPNSSGKDFEARCTHYYACPPLQDAADEGFLSTPPYEDPVEVCKLISLCKSSTYMHAALPSVIACRGVYGTSLASLNSSKLGLTEMCLSAPTLDSHTEVSLYFRCLVAWTHH